MRIDPVEWWRVEGGEGERVRVRESRIIKRQREWRTEVEDRLKVESWARLHSLPPPKQPSSSLLNTPPQASSCIASLFYIDLLSIPTKVTCSYSLQLTPTLLLTNIYTRQDHDIQIVMASPQAQMQTPPLLSRRSSGAKSLSLDLSDLPALITPSPPSNTLLITVRYLPTLSICPSWKGMGLLTGTSESRPPHHLRTA
jgi:hypothetical protein